MTERARRILINGPIANPTPAKPPTLNETAARNWTVFWNTIVSLADKFGVDPTYSDESHKFSIETPKFVLIMNPAMGTYNVHPEDDSTSFGAYFTTQEDILEKLKQKKFI